MLRLPTFTRNGAEARAEHWLMPSHSIERAILRGTFFFSLWWCNRNEVRNSTAVISEAKKITFLSQKYVIFQLSITIPENGHNYIKRTRAACWRKVCWNLLVGLTGDKFAFLATSMFSAISFGWHKRPVFAAWPLDLHRGEQHYQHKSRCKFRTHI